MNKEIIQIISSLESIKRKTKNGGEYWKGRELMDILGYTRWENFKEVIGKARGACQSVGENIDNHFLDTTKMIETGKGARVEVSDCFLDRYACYLIAQNGNSLKPEIAAAQTYFAIQTRRQEMADTENRLLHQRVNLRERVTKAVKELNKVAKDAGVENFGAFQNAGYQGLYSMGLADIKKRKGIMPKEDLFDRAGRAELAANEFRLTQAEDKIKRDGIVNQGQAISTHKEVAKQVRETIRKLGGVMPEDLEPEASLKKLTKSNKKIAKKN